MGYVKDNFPGSVAQHQRKLVARGMIGFSICLGSLIYAFSPFARAHREAVKEGLWDTPNWIREKESKKNTFSQAKVFTRKELEKALEHEDKIRRGDVIGPDLLKAAQTQP